MTDDAGRKALEKEARLKELLASCGSVAIAYSGGVDSTYLADVAHEVLGERAFLVLADSPSLPRSELAAARAVAEQRGWQLTVMATAEFDDADFLRNDALRCYYCKGILFDAIRAFADQHDVAVVLYGENADDVNDATRVGTRAAREREVMAPLREVGLSKSEVRELSRRRGLTTWDHPAMACLASRIPTDTPIEVAELARVEQAEEVLKRLGFHQCRARHHGALCRIEVEACDLARIVAPDVREEVVAELRRLGFRRVTVDLTPYGSSP